MSLTENTQSATQANVHQHPLSEPPTPHVDADVVTTSPPGVVPGGCSASVPLEAIVMSGEESGAEDRTDDLVIDPEFAKALPRLTDPEYRDLVESMRTDGCRDAIIVWRTPSGRRVVVDGHNRLQACRELGIKPQVREVNFTDRAAATTWIMANALARRNLPLQAVRYFRGRLYREAQKSPGRRTDRIEVAGPSPTEQVADRFNVDKTTLRRDARFAEQVDLIAQEKGEGYKADILSGREKVKKSDVVGAASPRRANLKSKRPASSTAPASVTGTEPTDAEVDEIVKKLEYLGVIAPHLTQKQRGLVRRALQKATKAFDTATAAARSVNGVKKVKSTPTEPEARAS